MNYNRVSEEINTKLMNLETIEVDNKALIKGYYPRYFFGKYLFDKYKGLFYQRYTFKDKNNFGEVFWFRDNSWFTLLMAGYLECRENLGSTISSYILVLLNNQVEAIIEYQSETGFGSIIGTILRVTRLKYIDAKYLTNFEKIIEGILENINDDGIIWSVLADISIDHNEEHYGEIITAPMAYGQAIEIILYLNHI